MLFPHYDFKTQLGACECIMIPNFNCWFYDSIREITRATVAKRTACLKTFDKGFFSFTRFRHRELFRALRCGKANKQLMKQEPGGAFMVL